MVNQSDNSIIALDSLDTLSFDQFGRDPERDIICVAPVRTMVHREEEIDLTRRVRKVEEVDTSPVCPVRSTQITKVYQKEGYQAESITAQSRVSE